MINKANIGLLLYPKSLQALLQLSQFYKQKFSPPLVGHMVPSMGRSSCRFAAHLNLFDGDGKGDIAAGSIGYLGRSVKLIP